MASINTQNHTITYRGYALIFSEFMDTYNKAFEEAFPLVRLACK